MASGLSKQSMRDRPVGFFDSGLGGLTVVREFRKIAPSERVLYLGDTARLPYGTKSPDAVRRFAVENAVRLVERGIKALVIACSTASSVALGLLKEMLRVPVIGVTEAGGRARVFRRRQFRSVGVIGTTGTVLKGEYQRLVRELQPGARIVAKACPLFVPLVEEGITSGPIAEAVVDYYLRELRGVEALVLGCTHYPLLKPLIARYMEGTTLVDPSEEAAFEVARRLKDEGLEAQGGPGGVEVLLTDLPPGYEELVRRFLGEDKVEVKRI